jgi:hypothetical protein
VTRGKVRISQLKEDGRASSFNVFFLSHISLLGKRIPLHIMERKENGVAKNSSLLSQGGSDLLKSQKTQDNFSSRSIVVSNLQLPTSNSAIERDMWDEKWVLFVNAVHCEIIG